MSIGLTSALNNAKSSLLVRQKELNLIANNISNSSVAGYHRQTVTLSENPTQATTDGIFGSGVHIAAIVRSFDKQLESSLQSSISSSGYKNSYANLLSNLETTIAPGGTSPLNDAVLAFSTAVQALKTSPENTTCRSSLISAAKTLADRLNSDYAGLAKVRDAIGDRSGTEIPELSDPANDLLVEKAKGSAGDTCDELNIKFKRIAELNEEIYNIETNYRFSNSQANDLRDERDRLVKDIAQYVNIDVTENADFRYDISITASDGTSVDIIRNDPGSRFTAKPNSLIAVVSTDTTGVNPDNGVLSFTVQNAKDGTYTPTFTLGNESGALGAMSEARVYINTQMTNLYSYAKGMTDTVNGILQNGQDLQGNAGEAMFNTLPDTPANAKLMNLTVNPNITPDRVAASDLAPGTVPPQSGNGENMLTLWNALNTTTAINGNNGTYMTYANTFINGIAQDVSAMESSAKISDNLTLMYQNAVTNHSGVNVDDEMTNMLEIQRMYQASAKIITTIDTMYETVLSLK